MHRCWFRRSVPPRILPPRLANFRPNPTFVPAFRPRLQFRMPSEARVAAPISPAEALRIFKTLYYDADFSVEPLPGEYDDNFEIFALDWGFVLKIMHPDREDSFVDLQCQALTHLERSAPQLKLPRVVPTLSRKPFERIEIDGRSRIIFCLSYINH